MIMPSIYDLALTVTMAHVVLLAGHRVFTNILGTTSSEEIQAEDQLERHAKASFKSPEPFSGNIGD